MGWSPLKLFVSLFCIDRITILIKIEWVNNVKCKIERGIQNKIYGEYVVSNNEEDRMIFYIEYMSIWIISMMKGILSCLINTMYDYLIRVKKEAKKVLL